MPDSEEDESLIVKRQSVEINDYGRFKIHHKTYDKQFCNIYIARLAALKDAVIAAAKQKWGPRPIMRIDRLSELDEQETVIIVGTLYKHQEFKPSILRDLSDELQVPYQPQRSKYFSEKDLLFLEDEVLRTKLLGNRPDAKEVVTGLVCAVLGCGTSNGEFWVEDWTFPGCCPVTSSSAVSEKKNGKLLLISGLDFANKPECMSTSLLSEWLSGLAGLSDAQEEEASVVEVLIAGNSVRSSIETFSHGETWTRHAHPTPKALESILATHRFDSYLSEIVPNCEIIVMPGEFDPTDHSIPQQPLHPCMLPNSSRYSTLRCVTNPWIGRIGKIIVSGSSGQPIDDIMRVAGLEAATAIDWLEKTLIWRHFAPTAPDTLPAYPYFDTDPFVMTECPDIYFAGNMKEFATKMYIGEEGQSVRLICIPKFSKTATAVLVDLNSLDVRPISFGTS